MTHDAEATAYAELDSADPAAIEQRCRDLAERALAALAAQGIDPATCTLRRVAEIRYVGQTYEVPVPAPDDFTADGALVGLQDSFHAEHANRYGVSDPESPVALVNLRVTATGATEKPPVASAATLPSEALETTRPVLFADGGWQEVPIYQRKDLAAGTTLNGPTIIEQRGSTLVVPAGWTVVVDEFANLVAQRT